jgi:hypothetical protein
VPRDRANIQTAIWASQDWRKLGPIEQWLYELLLTHPSLSYAGVTNWIPKRLAFMAAGIDQDAINTAGANLQAARFIFVDPDTDEVVLRSFLRHDGLLKNPKVAVSMANDFAAIASTGIQKVIVHELRRLFSEYPDWAGFKQERVRSLLKLDGDDMDDLLTAGYPQAFPQALGEALPQAFPQAFPLHTATATATSETNVSEGGVGGGPERPSPPDTGQDRAGEAQPKRKPSKPLPDNWTPTDNHWEYARTHNLDLEAEVINFKGHAETHDRRCANWNSAFSMWLRKSKPKAPTPQGGDQFVPDQYRMFN